jgi:hypothetical protein
MTMSSAGRLEKVRKGFIRFLAMFAYLLVVLTMFQLHEYLVLEEHGIPSDLLISGARYWRVAIAKLSAESR